ncbi:uncharacterized protein [Argopecten irradians]|uniref:uncharacterized protein n=1 Tax=Argopecten irradians TaxID=31199 RepID=UPI0037198905
MACSSTSLEETDQDTVEVPIVLTYKNNTFHCKACRNNTQSRNAFEEHMVRHCQLLPYICISCKTTFKLKSEMENHVKQVHKNEKVRCGMQGMKDVGKKMKHLLEHGKVKFSGYSTKQGKLNSVSAGASGPVSCVKSAVDIERKKANEKQSTVSSSLSDSQPTENADKVVPTNEASTTDIGTSRSNANNVDVQNLVENPVTENNNVNICMESSGGKAEQSTSGYILNIPIFKQNKETSASVSSIDHTSQTFSKENCAKQTDLIPKLQIEPIKSIENDFTNNMIKLSEVEQVDFRAVSSTGESGEKQVNESVKSETLPSGDLKQDLQQQDKEHSSTVKEHLSEHSCVPQSESQIENLSQDKSFPASSIKQKNTGLLHETDLEIHQETEVMSHLYHNSDNTESEQESQSLDAVSHSTLVSVADTPNSAEEPPQKDGGQIPSSSQDKERKLLVSSGDHSSEDKEIQTSAISGTNLVQEREGKPPVLSDDSPPQNTHHVPTASDSDHLNDKRRQPIATTYHPQELPSSSSDVHPLHTIEAMPISTDFSFGEELQLSAANDVKPLQNEGMQSTISTGEKLSYDKMELPAARNKITPSNDQSTTGKDESVGEKTPPATDDGSLQQQLDIDPEQDLAQNKLTVPVTSETDKDNHLMEKGTEDSSPSVESTQVDNISKALVDKKSQKNDKSISNADEVNSTVSASEVKHTIPSSCESDGKQNPNGKDIDSSSMVNENSFPRPSTVTTTLTESQNADEDQHITSSQESCNEVFKITEENEKILRSNLFSLKFPGTNTTDKSFPENNTISLTEHPAEHPSVQTQSGTSTMSSQKKIADNMSEKTNASCLVEEHCIQKEILKKNPIPIRNEQSSARSDLVLEKQRANFGNCIQRMLERDPKDNQEMNVTMIQQNITKGKDVSYIPDREPPHVLHQGQTHPRDPSPVSHQRQSQPRDPSPVSHQSLNQPRDPSPVSHQRQNQPRDPSPISHQRQSQPRDPSPVSHQRQNQPRDPSPVSHQRQSQPRDPSPVSHQRQSQPRDPSPVSHQSLNQPRDPSPVSHQRQNQPRDLSPVSHQRQSQPRDPSPVSHQSLNQPRDPSPVSHQRQSQPRDPSPVLHQMKSQDGQHIPNRGPSPVGYQSQRQIQPMCASQQRKNQTGEPFSVAHQRLNQFGQYIQTKGPSPEGYHQVTEQSAVSQQSSCQTRGPSPVGQQRHSQDGLYIPTSGPSPVGQQRHSQDGLYIPTRGPSPHSYQSQIRGPPPVGHQSQSRGPSPVGHQSQTRVPYPVGHQSQARGPSPVGQQSHSRGPSPVGYQSQARGPSPVGHQSHSRGPSPVGHQSQASRPSPVGHQSQARGPSPVGHQSQARGPAPVGHQSQARGPSPVGHQSQTRGPSPVGHQSHSRGSSPIQLQQQRQLINQARSVSPVYLQQLEQALRRNNVVDRGTHSNLQIHEEAMVQRMSIFNITCPQSTSNSTTVKDSRANSSSMLQTNNLTTGQTPCQFTPITSSQVNPTYQQVRTSAPSVQPLRPSVGQFMTIVQQTDVTPGPLNITQHTNIQSILSRQLPSFPEVRVAAPTSFPQTGYATRAGIHQAAAVASAGFPNFNPADHPNVQIQQPSVMHQSNVGHSGAQEQTILSQQQLSGTLVRMPAGVLITGQNASLLGVSQFQENPNQSAAGPICVSQVSTAQTRGIMPRYILSQNQTIQPTVPMNNMNLLLQSGNQTQIRGPPMVSLLQQGPSSVPTQQTQISENNQNQVRRPSLVPIQPKQIQDGNQRRGPPVTVPPRNQDNTSQLLSTPALSEMDHNKSSEITAENKEDNQKKGSESATKESSSIGKISKQVSLKATLKIAELFRKTRTDKEIQNKKTQETSNEVNDNQRDNMQPRVEETSNEVNDNQRDIMQPRVAGTTREQTDKEASVEKQIDDTSVVQPKPKKKKKDKGDFRKVGPDFLCIACRIETQSEVEFRRHVWVHFHVSKNLCQGCQSSISNTAKCQLVMSVIDGLKFGCSAPSTDTEPVQVKTEPEDDDIVILDHIPPPKKVIPAAEIKCELTSISPFETSEFGNQNKEGMSHRSSTPPLEITACRSLNMPESADQPSLTSPESDTSASQLSRTCQGNSERVNIQRRPSLSDTEAEATPGSETSNNNQTEGGNNSSQVTKDRTVSRLQISKGGRHFIYQFVGKKIQQKKSKSNSTESKDNDSNVQTVQNTEVEADPVTYSCSKEIENTSADEKEIENKSDDEKEIENKSDDEKEIEIKSNDEKEIEIKSDDEKEIENKSADEKEIENKSADEPSVVDEDHVSSENNTGNFYICGGFDSCQFSCLTVADFYKHMLTVHGSASSFLCVHCGCPSPNLQQLMRHLHSHLKGTSVFFKCFSGCRFETNILKDYSSHLINVHHSSTTFMCTFCEESFTSVDLLVRHMQESTLKFVRCPFCKVADTNANLIKQHLASTHPGQSRHLKVACEIVCRDRKKYNYQRRSITLVPETASLLDEEPAVVESRTTETPHVDTSKPIYAALSDTSDEEETAERNISHTNVYEDNTTTSKTATKTRPALSLRVNEPVIHEISACDSTVSPTPMVYSNEEDQADSDNNSPTLQKCVRCSFATEDKRSFLYHKEIHSMKEQHEKIFTCPICPDGMPTIQKFRDHMNSHIGNNTVTVFYCDLCEIASNKLEKIQTHGTQFHKDFKEDTHISTREMKFSFKAFVCDDCDFCTTDEETFNMHAETHVAEVPVQLTDQKCPYCIYYTQDLHMLSLHINNMHQKQLKKEKRNRKSSAEQESLFSRLKDYETPNKFSSQSSTSVGSVQVKSTSCGTPTDQSNIPISISGPITTETTKGIESQSPSTSSDVYQSQIPKRYQCNKCSKSFSVANQLKAHMNIHIQEGKINTIDITLYKCSHCDYSSTEMLWTKRHDREVHKQKPKTTKHLREVIHVGKGTAETSDTSNKDVQTSNVIRNPKPFLIPVQNTFPERVKCCECDFSTRDRAALVIHITKHSTLYPKFEDLNEIAENRKQNTNSETASMDGIENKNEAVGKGKKTSRKCFDTQASSTSSEDSSADQDVFELLTDENSDEFEREETPQEENKGKLGGEGENESTSENQSGYISQEVLAEKIAPRSHRRSKECEVLFKLGGDLLHSRLMPCFSKGKNNALVCDICNNSTIVDKAEFHRHLLEHMNLWFFMCGYCDFHCFENSAMTSHFNKFHKNQSPQTLKMEVDDFRNRINEIIHCRKAGVPMSSLISIKAKESSINKQQGMIVDDGTKREEASKTAKSHNGTDVEKPKASASKSSPASTSVPAKDSVHSKGNNSKISSASTSVPAKDSVHSKGNNSKSSPASTSVPAKDSVHSKGNNSKSSPASTSVPAKDSVQPKGSTSKSSPASTSVPAKDSVQSKGNNSKISPASTSVPAKDSVHSKGNNTKSSPASTSVPAKDSVQSKGNNTKSSPASTSVPAKDSVQSKGNNTKSSPASTSVPAKDSVQPKGSTSKSSPASTTSVPAKDSVQSKGSTSKSSPASTTSVPAKDSVQPKGSTSKSSPDKHSVHESDKSLSSQKLSGQGKVISAGSVHKCSICNYKSTNRNDVVHHLPIHSKRNKHCCNLCAFQTSVAGDLRLHMTKRHPEEIKTSTGKATCSKEWKELKMERNSRSNKNDLSSDDTPSSAKTKNTVKTSSSATNRATSCVTKTNQSTGKKTSASKQASEEDSELATTPMKTIFKDSIKRFKGLFKCSFCKYCSKWGNNMIRHIQAKHNVKVLVSQEEEESSDQSVDENVMTDEEDKKDDEEDEDVEKNEDEEDEDEDVENTDEESEKTETSEGSVKSDDAEKDDRKRNSGKTSLPKEVMYTCDVQADSSGHFPCSLCGNILKNKANLYRHAIEVHNAEIKNGYTCLSCKKNFKLRTHFLKHLKTGTKCDRPWYMCRVRYCRTLFYDREKTAKHTQKEHSKQMDPEVINTRKMKLAKCVIARNTIKKRERKAFSEKDEKTLNKTEEKASSKTVKSSVEKKGSLASKMEERSVGSKEERGSNKEKVPRSLCYSQSPGMKDIQCGSCNCQSTQSFPYQLHCNRRHSSLSLRCFFCRKFTTTSMRHLIYHTIDIHKKNNLKFYHVAKTEQHEKTADKFKKAFGKKNRIKNKSIIKTDRYFGSHRSPLASKDNKLKAKQADLKKQNKKATEVKSPRVKSSNGGDKGVYRCMAVKGCNDTFGKADSLHFHIQKHFNYKPYKCGICGFSFFVEGHVKMHHTKVHDPETKFKFSVERNVVMEKQIAKYLRRGRPGYSVKTKFTEMDAKKFTEMDAKMIRNGPGRLFNQSGGKQPIFKCKKCRFEADTKKKMVDHVYGHFPQIYKCPFCNHTRYPRSLVLDHMADIHPHENTNTPVINLMKPNAEQSTKDQSRKSESSSQSSDTDVYSDDQVCPSQRKTKSSGVRHQKSETSDSDPMPQKSTSARKRPRISSDSEDEENVTKKRKHCKANPPKTRLSKRKLLTSSSNTEEEEEEEKEEDETMTDESDEETESSSSETEESSSSEDSNETDEDEDSEDIVPIRRKRRRHLSDSTTDEKDTGPTCHFCHQCSFQTEDLKIYCRHLVTHGGFNQLCPRPVPKDIRSEVEQQLERLLEGHSKKEGTTFLCAYCSYMAVTSFRVKQHILSNHPHSFPDYMELHTKDESTNVMVAAMQPSIVVTDICKMELIDLAMMFKHEGVWMSGHHGNQQGNHCEETRPDNDGGSSSKNKRKKYSIMNPSKYYKKSTAHTDIHQDDAENRATSSNHCLHSEEKTSDEERDLIRISDKPKPKRNLFNAIVQLSREDRNATQGFENIMAEYLSAERKSDDSLTSDVLDEILSPWEADDDPTGTLTNTNSNTIKEALTPNNLDLRSPDESQKKIMTLSTSVNKSDSHSQNDSEMETPSIGSDSLNTKDSEMETQSIGSDSLNTKDSEMETPSIGSDSLNTKDSEMEILTISSDSLNQEESEKETLSMLIYEDISDCSDDSEDHSDHGGQDSGQSMVDNGLTIVSSTTNNMDGSDWSPYSDISDCSDPEEDPPAVTEKSNNAMENILDEDLMPSSSTVKQIETNIAGVNVPTQLYTEGQNIEAKDSDLDILPTAQIPSDHYTRSVPQMGDNSSCIGSSYAGGDNALPSSSSCEKIDNRSDSEPVSMETGTDTGLNDNQQGSGTPTTDQGSKDTERAGTPYDEFNISEEASDIHSTSDTLQSAKWNNSLPLVITGENVMSSIDCMLDSLSDIKQTDDAGSLQSVTDRHGDSDNESIGFEMNMSSTQEF